ncbi:MAG: MFS transporter [Candidatus Thorarchaeota archaeon]
MGALSGKAGHRIIIILGLLLGISMSFFITFTTHFFWVLLILCGFGIGMAMVISSTSAYVSDLSKRKDYGVAIGVLSTIMDIGQNIGPNLSRYVLIALSVSFQNNC